MKRMLALLMVLCLVLSLGATAFAAENDGKITITNATKGHDYNLYKIFDATYTVDGSGNADGVSYSIDPVNNPYFDYLFDPINGTASPYFTYNSDNDEVTRVKNSDTSAIFAYLTDMVRDSGVAPIRTATANNATVVFDGLEHGYYLIDKGVDTAVTITSNTPTVEVIDKNQIPGASFDKLVWDEDIGAWVTESTASIGEIVKFKIEFAATNYDGAHQIKHYTIKDTKGTALWFEFNSFSITVNDGSGTEKELKRGYCHCVSSNAADHTGEWDYLNKAAWEEEFGPGEANWNPDGAEWYLIHRGVDEVDIVIPWLEGHDFTGSTSGYTLEYNSTTSKFLSPAKVTIEYTAAVEPSATIGTSAQNNLWNEADLTWTHTFTNGPEGSEITNLTTYALGLRKIDADTEEYLAGAEFALFSNEACTNRVYVIPTGIQGVYMVDDLATVVSGEGRETARETYKAYLSAYLGSETQKNIVTTAANGKLIVLGLEAGNYWLVETTPPDGYNTLASKISVAVGESNNTFFVIADAAGNVIDAQGATEGYTRHSWTATIATVENSKGVVLPSTGGTGTVTLITIGTLVALAFGVLLITHKKMKAYQD